MTGLDKTIGELGSMDLYQHADSGAVVSALRNSHSKENAWFPDSNVQAIQHGTPDIHSRYRAGEVTRANRSHSDSGGR